MRHILKAKTLLLLVVIILCSCSPREKGMLEVDLTNYSSGRILQLDEQMTDIRVVRLETGKESLIPQYYQSYIGEKYILILTDKTILQFDRDGKFIRRIGKQGKGPGEYTGINEFAVDRSESKLYIYHWGNSDHLLGFNLNTGEVLPSIKLPYNDVSTFILTKDHILFVADRNSTRELFTISFEGELLDTLSNLYQKNSGSYTGRGEYLRNLDGKIYYLALETDSLFLVDGVQKSVAYFFKVDNRYNYDDTKSGNLLMFSTLSANKSMLSITKLHIERMGNGIYSRTDGEDIFFLNNQTETADYISGFYHNYFEIEVKDFPIGSRGNVCYLKYSAIDFKELLGKALENTELDLKRADKFRELNATISEDDNPIYLIGKIVD